jgi:ATP-dependent helicase/DNAse subunit B
MEKFPVNNLDNFSERRDLNMEAEIYQLEQKISNIHQKYLDSKTLQENEKEKIEKEVQKEIVETTEEILELNKTRPDLFKWQKRYILVFRVVSPRRIVGYIAPQ